MEQPDYNFDRAGVELQAGITAGGIMFGGRLETGEHIEPGYVSWAELDTVRAVRDGTYGVKPNLAGMTGPEFRRLADAVYTETRRRTGSDYPYG